MTSLPELSSEHRSATRHVVVYSIAQLSTAVLLPIPFGYMLIYDCMQAVRWISAILSLSQLTCAMFGLLGKKYTPTNQRHGPWRILIQKLKALAQGFGILLISTFIFFELSVLFGAPFTNLLEETFFFGVLLTILTTFPGCLAWGVRPHVWAKMLLGSGPESTYERAVMHVGIFSIMGAWLGAFPIPLDWDRPWQLWPISCSIGALSGYIAGNVYNLYYHYKKAQQKRKRT